MIRLLRYIFFSLNILLLLTGCSSGKEVIMPFRNMGYSGERLFPVQTNDSDKIFRVWINNGTSVDRVITVSSDNNFGNQCEIQEFGFVTKGSKQIKHYSTNQIQLKNGYESFFRKIDSLKVFDIKSQTQFRPIVNHEPFSLYVIELKIDKKYHQFKFMTYYPNRNEKVEPEYEAIQSFILSEFDYKFHM